MNPSVGLRIKKIKGWNIGAEGVITAVLEYDPETHSNMLVKAISPFTGYDYWTGLPVHMPAGVEAYSHSEEWEPIVPEGYKVTHWDQCLWQPDNEEEFDEAFAYVREHQK